MFDFQRLQQVEHGRRIGEVLCSPYSLILRSVQPGCRFLCKVFKAYLTPRTMHPFGANPQNTRGSIPASTVAKVDFASAAFPQLVCSPDANERSRQSCNLGYYLPTFPVSKAYITRNMIPTNISNIVLFQLSQLQYLHMQSRFSSF